MSKRLLKILIILLLVSGLALYWQRWAIAGTSFLFTLAGWVCLLLALLLALFLPWKNPRIRAVCRTLRWLYLAGVIGFLLSFAIAQSLIWHTAAQAREVEPDAPCLLVLGAGLFAGETPSQVLQNRLLAALDYLRAHPQSVAVLSGGQGPNEAVTEAFAMRRWLIHNGIAEDRLYMEDRSNSTGANIAFSKPLIRELGYDTAVIVTNDFHLLRASLLAKHYGLGTQLLGAPTPKIFLIPATYYIREYFALVRAWLLLNFYPQGLPSSE